MKIVEPVVLRPLANEWQTAKSAIAKAKRTARKDELYLAFREMLGAYRVFDPACGSGNFLYLALRHLKDFDRLVEEEAKALGATSDPKGQRITPKSVLGIEVNPYAAELARVTVWIGELQWQLRNGYGVTRRPILGALEGIQNRDALLNADGSEAEWPTATVIIGNPPFLGGKLLRRNLRDRTVDSLFEVYGTRVPAEADLVCYWFAKALDQLLSSNTDRIGLVTTNSIRGGANRVVLDRIKPAGRIFEAWSDEAWVLDGAAVRVSLVCYERQGAAHDLRLDGRTVKDINSDLTSASFDLTKAARLAENADVAFMGDTKGGSFDVPGHLAREWLKLPRNPNGRPNADVLRPWVNGFDLTRRPQDKWIIDFGWTMTETEAAAYEAPFEYIAKNVKPERVRNNRKLYAENWWRHVEARQGMIHALGPLQTQIITPRVAKHRLFVRRPTKVLADSATIVVARDDYVTFGILHSRVHELWTLRLCTWLGVGNDPRYTPSTTFETFPFPHGLAPSLPAKRFANDTHAKRIGAAAANLDELRENWLNPPDLVKPAREVVSGYPERFVAKDNTAAAALDTRTLTNLYNERPTWLAHAHRELDRAVVAAYGWPATLASRAQLENQDSADRVAAEEDILERLFKLNQARTKAAKAARTNDK